MGVTAVLLAGGRSSRMGRDKASLLYEGRPLAERAVDVLREIADEIFVASGDGERLSWLGERQVADAVPDAGPLGGIVAGLEAANRELVAVLAVDMPFAGAPILRLLAERWAGGDAVIPRTERGLEPLHAVYARSAAPVLRAQLEGGVLSVVRAVEMLDVLEVGPEEWSAADPSGRFAFNVNRPEDLSR
ncbi:MAG: molybdenum cofactor guanylyltransferase [Actinomycetota bacterium]